MGKVLSIIIPHYKENEVDLFPLLSSIGIQVGIDFKDIEVIISNDGGEFYPLNNDFFSLFPLDVRQVYLSKNEGPGVARQNGIDASTADYIMCCDADDCLHNVGVIDAFIREISENRPDIITSSWIEEFKKEDGSFGYLVRDHENTWMFGKVIRREFLEEKHIRFHDSLRIHEDSYFLSIASDVASSKRHINILSYIWKYKANSITRKDDAIYTYSSLPTFINAFILSLKELEERGSDSLEYKVCQFTCYIYTLAQRKSWNTETHRKYRFAMEKEFKKKIRPFWHYYLDATEERMNKIYYEEIQKNLKDEIASESFYGWLKKLDLPVHFNIE